MDRTLEKNRSIANTKKQPLVQHLFSVGYVAYCLVNALTDNKKLALSSFVAGCFHDLGKLEPQFQSWLLKVLKKESGEEELPEDGVHIDQGKFSFEKHPRHNEISLILYGLLNDEGRDKLNAKQRDDIKHAVYWHHAKPFRKTDYENQHDIYKTFAKSLKEENKINLFVKEAIQLLKGINELSENYTMDDTLQIKGIKPQLDEEMIDRLKEKNLPIFKDYSNLNDELSEYVSNVRDNARHNLIRSAVIASDRKISSLKIGELETLINTRGLADLADKILRNDSDLQTAISSCLEGFKAQYPGSERNQEQSETAKKLSEIEEVAVLKGPAGCGKTKIALEWALNSHAQKIIWVCPRVQVCLGLFNDLTAKNYLAKAKIEICTGEFRKIEQDGKCKETDEHSAFSGDVVITTVDQIINSIITHTKVTTLIDFMNSHVVFDEYHELITQPGFNLLFAELVECKKMRGEKAHTLLVSATPNSYFVENLLKIDRDDIEGIKSFNQSRYQVNFEVFDDTIKDIRTSLNSLQEKDSTFVITNTVIAAQRSFIENQSQENAILIHSKYKKEDKSDLFNQVIESFKEGGDRRFSVLRSSPIVQASLNISCDQMVTEFTNAENWLQRLGRLDRFGKNEQVNPYITVLSQSIEEGKGKCSCARFLSSQNTFLSAKAWYHFLKEHLPDSEVNINHIYELYEAFYNDDTARNAIEKDLKKALKDSVVLLNKKVMDPLVIPAKKKPKDGKIKIKKHSLRGDNRFVQMAVYHVSDEGKFSFSDKYAYPEDIDSQTNNIGLTATKNEITGYGKSERSLLVFMAQKHHKILSQREGSDRTFKRPDQDNFLLELARDPSTPIYLSYTPEDLDLCNDKRHSYAIYYVTSNKQPIGAIAINKLTNEGE